MAGLFITFEGIEGSGKTSRRDRLAERLRAQSREVLLLREPGGTPFAESVRALLLDPRSGESGALPPWSEACLVLAARAQLVDQVIRPALAQGRTVLCDRFADSTIAYQGEGRGLDRDLLARLNRAVTGGLAPRLTLLLDLAVEGALRRLEDPSRSGALTRFDRESRDFHERVRAGFLRLAQEEPGRFAVIDAARPEAQVDDAVWARVAPLLR